MSAAGILKFLKLTLCVVHLQQQVLMHLSRSRLSCEWPTGLLLQFSEHFTINHCLLQTLLQGSYPQSRSTCKLSYSPVEF